MKRTRHDDNGRNIRWEKLWLMGKGCKDSPKIKEQTGLYIRQVNKTKTWKQWRFLRSLGIGHGQFHAMFLVVKCNWHEAPDEPGILRHSKDYVGWFKETLRHGKYTKNSSAESWYCKPQAGKLKCWGILFKIEKFMKWTHKFHQNSGMYM